MRAVKENPALLIRPARLQDREAIVEFCRHTGGPDGGDYVEHAIDRWLAGDDGMLAVVEGDGRAVACCYTRLMSPHEAFLSGMRVDPAHRRAGLAVALVEYCLGYARAQGPTIGRLIVGRDNAAALALVARADFRRVGTMTAWDRTVPGSARRPPHAHRLAPGDPMPSPPRGALWGVGWAVRELTAADVAERAAAGHAFALGESVALLRPGEDHLWLAWLDGPEAGRRGLAEAALAATGAAGFPRCRALLSNDPRTDAALEAAGFDRGLQYHVFERNTG